MAIFACHHWTVHEKVDGIPKFPPDTWWGVYTTTFDPVLRNAAKTFSHVGPGVCIFHNF